MRTLVRALIILVLAISSSGVLVAKGVQRAPASDRASSSLIVMGSPAWNSDGQPEGGAELGFSPLSVTQSGVAYSPAAAAAAPAAAPDPTAGDPAKIADLPAWASSYSGEERDGHQGWLGAIGLHSFGNMSGPVAWALVIIGVALIGGALRGLIVANRRLDRLRSDDDLDE